jgi:predicted ATPase
MVRQLPTGTVTLLFTDVEGSTRLLHELGAEAYAEALAHHRGLIREACAAHGGVEVDTQGDAFFVAFASAGGGIAAARAAQEALAAGPIRVRMGLHTGTPRLTAEGYVGEDVHLGARIAAAGYGGQVLLSVAARAHADGEVTDLGEHRLKDFADAVAIFQLGSARFPPLKTISNTNLPRPASSFVGREREVGEVAALLRDGARLVTLTGPGGSGKTRLAIEAAAELVPAFKAGVFWVGLATLRDSALVLDTVAQTLGAQDRLVEHIGTRELLLLLDNLEQVVDAAPDLATLVEACPNLRLLVTSRELLRVRGEVEYPVQPLAEPDAVDLFCARAGLGSDATVSELCRRLDNLPLAVELAAARTAVLSAAQILERLGQRLDLLKAGRAAEPRQQTLRATIEWSYDLLDPEEKQLFAGLAVFRGGCTLAAAEAVADANLDVLQSLVDKSLVRHTGERFWMLETIHEFALERPREADVAVRHARHYLQLAEDAHAQLIREPRSWLGRLEAEHDNLRAALDHLGASNDVERAAQLAGALHRFWAMHGHLHEGGERIERLLALAVRPTAVRARLLDAAAVMAFNRADYPTARRRAQDALALHDQLGEAWGATYSQLLLGNAASGEDDFETAARLTEWAALRFRELGDDFYARLANGNVGYYLQELGELDRAREVLEENVCDARHAGDDRSIAHSCGQLGQVAILQGRREEAVEPLVESLRIWDSLGDRAMSARDLRRLARVLAESARPEAAARVLAASETMREEADHWEGWIAHSNQLILDLVTPQLGEAAFERAWAEGSGMSVEDALALAAQPYYY